MLIFKGEFCCAQYRGEKEKPNPQYDWGDTEDTHLGIQDTVEPNPKKTQPGQVPMNGESPVKRKK